MTDLSKSFGLPETIMTGHEYVYRSGEDGVYQYWYVSQNGDFWEYTNAPKESKDFDPYNGEAIFVKEQPTPGTAPNYFSPEGRKLTVGVPEDANTLTNDQYSPYYPTNVWYGLYVDRNGGRRYVYLDTDVKINFDLWSQYQLRVVDAGIPAYRTYASKLFNSNVVKDRVIGSILMLVDQGMYPLQDLIFATVGDLEFVDTTVKLLGRKFVCDPEFLDFMTSLIVDRDIEAPLFVLETFQGEAPIGIRHITSIFYGLKISPTFLHYWHSNHTFSRIIHRFSLQGIPENEVLDMAYNELARVYATSDDVSVMIDSKVRDTLLRNYITQSNSLTQLDKSLTNINTDDFGVLTIWSDLTQRKNDEKQFSLWLHASPLHQETPEAEAMVAETVQASQPDTEEEESPEDVDANV